MSLLSKLFRHMAWADARALQSISSLPTPPAQAVDLFAHAVAAEHVWLCRILGATERVAVWPKLSLERAEVLARENHEGLAKLADEANGDGAVRLITYRNSRGVEYTNPLQDILLHVAQHGMYHRGQIAMLVRESGGTAISTDYILFARE